MRTFVSDLSKKEFPETDRVYAQSVRPPILKLICDEYPGFDSNGCLSMAELNVYRQKYIANYLSKEIGELSELEHAVLRAVEGNATLVDKIEDQEEQLSLGQMLADRVATFGGSWTFIIWFSAFMVLWIGINTYFLSTKPFDPYPFILLNLILSCMAAMQAPIIMMSQNRQEEKDRSRAKMDYMINLKSEVEIRMLHEKIDHLIMKQQTELIEIQKVQVEMMNDILDRVGGQPVMN